MKKMNGEKLILAFLKLLIASIMFVLAALLNGTIRFL